MSLSVLEEKTTVVGLVLGFVNTAGGENASAKQQKAIHQRPLLRIIVYLCFSPHLLLSDV